MKHNIKDLVKQMTLEEKAGFVLVLISGTQNLLNVLAFRQ